MNMDKMNERIGKVNGLFSEISSEFGKMFDDFLDDGTIKAVKLNNKTGEEWQQIEYWTKLGFTRISESSSEYLAIFEKREINATMEYVFVCPTFMKQPFRWRCAGGAVAMTLP